MALTDEQIIEQGSELVADTVGLIYDTATSLGEREFKAAWKDLAKRWIIFLNES